jgi:hypothetical protein
MDPNTQAGLPDQMQISYAETEQLGVKILRLLQAEQATFVMGSLAAMLVVARLFNPDKGLTLQREIKFIQDLNDWADAYFAQGEKEMN